MRDDRMTQDAALVTLKPCPFCGEKLICDPNEGAPFWVHRDRIKSDCWMADCYVLNEVEGEGGILEWNTRLAASDHPDERGGEALREALEPFLRAAEPVLHDDDRWDFDEWGHRISSLSVGQFRRLAAALSTPAASEPTERGSVEALREAGQTIEILRRALAWHGDPQRMATTREEWQQEIDAAIVWVKANPEPGRPSFSSFSTPAAPEPTEYPPKWAGDLTVGNMIANLQTMPADMPIHSAYHVVRDGKPSLLFVKHPTVSRERVDGRTIKTGDESVPYSAVVWSHCRTPDEDMAAPEPTEAGRPFGDE